MSKLLQFLWERRLRWVEITIATILTTIGAISTAYMMTTAISFITGIGLIVSILTVVAGSAMFICEGWIRDIAATIEEYKRYVK